MLDRLESRNSSNSMEKVQSPEDPHIPGSNDEGRPRSRAKLPLRSYYTPSEIHGLLPENIYDAAPSNLRVMAGLPSWSEVFATMEAKRDAIVAREKEEKRMRRWDVKAMRALRRWFFKLGCTSVPPPKTQPTPTHTTGGGADCSCSACRNDTSKPLSASQPQRRRFTYYVIEPGCRPRKVEPVFDCVTVQ